MTDSISWFHLSTKERAALPVQLFQAGYDVWLGNNRGTRHSRKHTFIDPDKQASWYWDFSHDEFGTKDIPAMVDLI